MMALNVNIPNATKQSSGSFRKEKNTSPKSIHPTQKLTEGYSIDGPSNLSTSQNPKSKTFHTAASVAEHLLNPHTEPGAPLSRSPDSAAMNDHGVIQKYHLESQPLSKVEKLAKIFETGFGSSSVSDSGKHADLRQTANSERSLNVNVKNLASIFEIEAQTSAATSMTSSKEDSQKFDTVNSQNRHITSWENSDNQLPSKSYSSNQRRTFSPNNSGTGIPKVCSVTRNKSAFTNGSLDLGFMDLSFDDGTGIDLDDGIRSIRFSLAASNLEDAFGSPVTSSARRDMHNLATAPGSGAINALSTNGADILPSRPNTPIELLPALDSNVQLNELEVVTPVRTNHTVIVSKSRQKSWHSTNQSLLPFENDIDLRVKQNMHPLIDDPEDANAASPFAHLRRMVSASRDIIAKVSTKARRPIDAGTLPAPRRSSGQPSSPKSITEIEVSAQTGSNDTASPKSLKERLQGNIFRKWFSHDAGHTTTSTSASRHGSSNPGIIGGPGDSIPRGVFSWNTRSNQAHGP